MEFKDFKVAKRKNEIVIDLNHGLGNQLSLYFAGLAYAQIFNKNLVAIVSGENQNRHDSCREILNLDLPGSFRIRNSPTSSFESKFRQSLSYRYPNTFKLTGDYYSPRPGYDEFLLNSPGIRRLSGFFHTFAYYDHCLAGSPDLTLEKIFPLRKYASDVAIKMRQNGTVAVHVRRGDYQSNAQSLGLLSGSYYKNALSILGERCKIKKLYVFSDDTKSARHLLEAEGLTGLLFPEDEGDLSTTEVIHLLGLSPNLVIANSSLSYWSAVLAGDETNIVTPRPFYRNLGISESFFYRVGWMLVNPEFM